VKILKIKPRNIPSDSNELSLSGEKKKQNSREKTCHDEENLKIFVFVNKMPNDTFKTFLFVV